MMRRAAAAGLAAAVLLGGCASGGPPTGDSALGFYAQAVGGHLEVVRRARPVDDWLRDAATPERLRQRLALTQAMRDFAVTELGLPDNASYRRYADLQRPAVVWNVVAAPELSLQLSTWCFPVMGCVGYRGYFDRARADAAAAVLRGQGLDVAVYGVPAYSTLGWSALLGGDPLLNTFVGWPEGELARLLFHELAHQVAYARDDTTFNESYATAVERLGGALWLERRADGAARAEYAALDDRRRAFRALTAATRAELQALYADGSRPLEARRRAKAEILATLRQRHAVLKTGAWGGFAGYDAWFAGVNNAALGVQAAYDVQVADFEHLFQRLGRDFPRFHAEVRRLAGLPRAERAALLSAR